MVEPGPEDDEIEIDERGGDGSPGDETDQGPRGDDPLAGAIDDADESLTADRDLVEPGLDEAQLAEADLGSVEERVTGLADETGLAGDDESEAAGGEFGAEASLLTGSDPAELPGATEGLFGDEAPSVLGDAGEEGFSDGHDLIGGLEEGPATVRGDSREEETGLGPDDPEAARGAAAPGASRIASGMRVPGAPVDPAAVVAAAFRDGLWLAFVEPAGPEGGGLWAWSADSGWKPAGPPLGVDGDEAPAVCGLGWLAVAGARPRLYASTDRGMLFGREDSAPGTPSEWSVERTWLDRTGAAVSWLQLGVDRAPFRLAPGPGDLWAWRPGGPVLRARGPGSWTCVGDDRTLRILAVDPVTGRAARFLSDGDSASVSAGDGVAETLPPAAADVVGTPGACAALSRDLFWLGAPDPAAPLLSGDGRGSWTAVAGVSGVRALAAAPSGDGVFAVAIDPGDEIDGIVRVIAGSPPRLLARADEIDRALGLKGAAPDRVALLAVARSGPPTAAVVYRGRLVLVPDAAGGGPA